MSESVVCLPVESVAPRYLNDDLEQGLLIAADRQAKFLIVDDGESKWAIIVSDSDFRGWKLEHGARHWHGLFIPNVSILVEPTVFDDSSSQPIAGQVTLAEGEVRIAFRPMNAMWAQEVKWKGGNLNPAVPHPRLGFSRWRIAVPDEVGRFVTLAECRPSTD